MPGPGAVWLPGMSKILKSAILKQVPGAEIVHCEVEHVFVLVGETVTGYRLSPEARRIALLEREGRPLDIQARRRGPARPGGRRLLTLHLPLVERSSADYSPRWLSGHEGVGPI